MRTEQTIFVIDDDAMVCETFRDILTAADYDVETYQSGKAFLNAYEPGRQGCLVLDLVMPDMDGIAVERALARQKSSLPIILISGHGPHVLKSAMTIGTALNLNISGVLTKPMLSEEIIKSVRRCVKRGSVHWVEHAASSHVKHKERQTERHIERALTEMMIKRVSESRSRCRLKDAEHFLRLVLARYPKNQRANSAYKRYQSNK